MAVEKDTAVTITDYSQILRIMAIIEKHLVAYSNEDLKPQGEAFPGTDKSEQASL